jgi:hypothetical protein
MMDLGEVKYCETKGTGYDVYGSHDHKIHPWVSGGHNGSPDRTDDYLLEKCRDHVHVIHEL